MPEFQATQTKTGIEITQTVNKRIYDRSAYFLSFEEAKALKETALTYGLNAVRYYVIICLGLNCGLRRIEITKLKIEQINLVNNMIELGLDTKTRTPRSIPIMDDLKKYLLMLISDRKEGYLLMHDSKNGSKKRYSQAQINNIVANIGAKANLIPKGGTIAEDGSKLTGLKNINPHLLRVSWAKLCRKSNIPKEHVRIMGGWHTTKMLDFVYATPDYDTITTEYKAKMNW